MPRLGGSVPKYRKHKASGQTAGSGVGDSANAAVPEPVTPVMLIVGMLGMLLCQRAVVS